MHILWVGACLAALIGTMALAAEPAKRPLRREKW